MWRAKTTEKSQRFITQVWRHFERTTSKEFTGERGNVPEKVKDIFREQKWVQMSPKEAGPHNNLYLFNFRSHHPYPVKLIYIFKGKNPWKQRLEKFHICVWSKLQLKVSERKNDVKWIGKDPWTKKLTKETKYCENYKTLNRTINSDQCTDHRSTRWHKSETSPWTISLSTW